MNKLIPITIIFFFSFSLANAQSKQRQQTSKGDDNPVIYDYKVNNNGKKVRRKNSKQSSITAYYDQKVEEYKERMEQVVKRNKKMAKEMQKPQYADPTYFGHKKPPKKRPAGKKKFCKVCEIWH